MGHTHAKKRALRAKSERCALLDHDTQVSYAATWMHIDVYFEVSKLEKGATKCTPKACRSLKKGVVGTPAPVVEVWWVLPSPRLHPVVACGPTCGAVALVNFLVIMSANTERRTKLSPVSYDNGSPPYHLGVEKNTYIALHLRVCAYKKGAAILITLVRRTAFLHHPLLKKGIKCGKGEKGFCYFLVLVLHVALQPVPRLSIVLFDILRNVSPIAYQPQGAR